jgi:aminocarboxymuconate-semialdehyde decarboxylase
VTINATVNGRHLGDPELDEFWSLAEALEVPILVHPSSTPPGGDVFSDLSLLEYGLRPSEVSLSVAAAVLAGVLDRHPRLELVAGAGGVGLPMLLLRLDVPHQYGGVGPPGAHRAVSDDPPSSYLERLYVDSCSFNQPTLEFNVRTLGPERVLFGTDSPPLTVPSSVSFGLIEQLPISEHARQEVLGGAAARLLKLEKADVRSLT